jgi:hypothetical protein
VVAVDQGAEVDHDQLPCRDPPLRRTGVGLGPVRARGDDRLERHVGRAQPPHREVELDAEVALAREIEEKGEHGLERIVRDPARGLDARQLARVLHPSQRLDEALRRHELGAGQ